MALGTRFESKRAAVHQLAIPVRLQCQFTYVPIIETLCVLFKNEHFLQTYLDYNKFGGNGHTCTPNNYIDFCCGRIFQNSSLFGGHLNNIQLQIYQDDFEVCVPIGSKATIHKICGIYFTIRNWPNNSRLDHIYLVALCNTDDLKSKSTDFNNIWRLVADEIRTLETSGIDVSSSLNLRGSLACICADKLGANSCLGFAESFSAAYYCRICELPKQMCQKTITEHLPSLRTIEKYDNSLQILKNLTKVDYSRTKGIRMNCVLNEIENFHVISNYCIDIMHDLQEGIIPFALKLIFIHCLEKNIFSLNMITARIQFHSYGLLNKRNIPSRLILDKQNLNQNASQLLCLFRHIPFILQEFKEELYSIWPFMLSLQKIVQILYSRRVSEGDLTTLIEAIENHLSFIKNHFKKNLIPKHHNITHYPSVIRAIGPLCNYTTIRFEAKHQTFKQTAKGNKNFRNLTKTLASKHQQKFSQTIQKFSTSLHIIPGKRGVFDGNILNIVPQFELKFLLIDDRKYEKGLLVLHDKTIHEIKFILETDKGFFLACKKYRFISYDEFTNSYKIEQYLGDHLILFDFETFKHYNLYEKILIGNDIFIIAENLEIHRAFE